MKPYLAIIWDSLREALHSRVLWIVLVLITLLLLAVAPLGVYRTVTVDVNEDDILRLPDLAAELVASRVKQQASPQRRIWDGLTGELQSDLRNIDRAEQRDRATRRKVRKQLVDELNALLENRDLFSAEQLVALRMRSEGRKLRDRPRDSLAEEEAQRLNRVALQAAFPRDIRVRPRQSLQFAYFNQRFGPVIPLSDDQFEEAVTQTLLVLQNGLLGPIGIFAAILVTASIIPNMLDEGSINLLLSKPISRTWLYLAKFVGGTSFTLICATYLLLGVWAVVGLKFGVWKSALIASIPVFVFIFVVYYCVSAFAGIVWRNAVVSVVITVLFWLMCFAVGTSRDTTRMLLLQPRRIMRIVPAGEDVVAVNESGDVVRWSEASREWKPILAPEGGSRGPAFARQNRLLGPVYDQPHQRLIVVDRNFANDTILGNFDSGYERAGTVPAPANSAALLVNQQGKVLAVGRDGVSRLVENPLAESPKVDMLGMQIPIERLVLTLPGRMQTGPWRPLGPDDLTIDDQTTAALDATDDSVFVASVGKLSRVARANQGEYSIAGEVQLEDEPRQVLVAAGGGVVIAANPAGRLQLLDAHTLEVRQTFEPMGATEPRHVAVSPDGRWLAALYHNGRLWLRDLQSEREIVRAGRGAGGISAIAFPARDRLYTADRIDRVTLFSLPELQVVQRYAPRLPLLDRVYWYGLEPLYTVFPKPGKLKETVSYIMTGKDAVPTQDQRNLQAARYKFDPWAPVYHSAVFTALMLALACWYLRRQEL